MVETHELPQGLAKRILTESEVHKILNVERDIRNRCILHLLYHAELRVSELCNLNWSDIREKEDGKGANKGSWQA